MSVKLDTVICGDCLEVLRTMDARSVNCCVTSPPYWGLRDYGVDGQLGLEKTPEEYVAKMVEVFGEVKRVLRDDGTLWLNLGDSYYGSWGGSGSRDGGQRPKHTECLGRPGVSRDRPGASYAHANLKAKDLCGIPWRVAFALQADGWYLRQDIIWHKPNPMPESVRDRCTKAHEYIFLMTKKPKYYYDAEAIKEPNSEGSIARFGLTDAGQTRKWNTSNNKRDGRSDGTKSNEPFRDHVPIGRNKRSVWTVTTKPYSEAHFATFPPDLILPCILAGCPQQVCKKCGEPRRRITETSQIKRRRKTPTTKPCDDRSPSANDVAGVESKTVGWTDCGCGAGFDGGIVLDPFMGSGTVGVVAYQNNRHYLGIELNPEYCKLGRIEKEQSKYALFESQQ